MRRLITIIALLAATASVLPAQELHNRYGFTLDRTASGYEVHTQKILTERFGCNPEAVPQWLEVYEYVPKAFRPEVLSAIDVRHLSYCRHSGFDYQMDVYLPQDYESGPARPVVMIIHHGVWSGGMRNGEATVSLARVMASRGLVAVAIGYSDITRGTISDAIWDIREAWSYIEANAPEWNVDPDKFALCGYSEGAHIAACASLLLPDVKALVDFSGIMNLSGMNVFKKYKPEQLGYYEAQTKEDLKKWSPTLMIPSAPSLPGSVFVVHGSYDIDVPCTQSSAFVRALKARKVKVDWREICFGHHNLLRPENYYGWEKMMEDMTDFLWGMKVGNP